MKRYILRFRFFLIALALAMAIIQYREFWENRQTESEMRSARIITPVLAPRFRQTIIGTKLDRTHFYVYVTNRGETLTAGPCGKSRIDLMGAGQQEDGNTVFEETNRGGTMYIIRNDEANRCVEAPSVEVGLELHRYLRGNLRDEQKR